ncbi:uncharacterized protein LOC132543303 [Ylistrum balloti]|uniref:uncharacterized protein LOC132543303 n=1 Tax=Ylistrum balloti TaxID=509963 RepID=UPI002905BB95|nr:uncharacterized protein LOC132543303 [Ylistrum balloti]
MSSSDLHTVVIRNKGNQPSLKRFEVRAPERRNETCARQSFILQLRKKVKMRKKKHHTKKWFGKGIKIEVLRDLLENKNNMLEAYVRQLLENDIRFNEIDLIQNQLQFEVLMKDETDIGFTVNTCLTPLSAWSVDSSNPTTAYFNSVDIDEISVGQGYLFFDQVFITENQKHCNKESALDPKSTDKDSDPVIGDEQVKDVQERLDDKGEEKDESKAKFTAGIFKFERSSTRHSGFETVKSPSEEKLLCDMSLNALKEPVTLAIDTKSNEESGLDDSKVTDIQDLLDQERFDVNSADKDRSEDIYSTGGLGGSSSGTEKTFRHARTDYGRRGITDQVREFSSINSISDSVENDADIKREFSERQATSKSVMDGSTENKLVPEITDTFNREDHVIDGDVQDQEAVTEMLFRNMAAILMGQVISSQSKAILRIKEVFLNLQSDVSAFFFKYHFYDVRITKDEVVLRLVAGLRKRGYTKKELAALTLLNGDQRHEDRRTDTHKTYRDSDKCFHNDRSKSWKGQTSIKDSQKSEGRNDIGNGQVPSKTEKGTAEPGDGHVKERLMSLESHRDSHGKVDESHFFPHGQPKTDSGDTEPDNATPMDSLSSDNRDSLDMSGNQGQPDDATHLPDRTDPEGSGSCPSDDVSDDMSDDGSENEESDELDFNNDYPGIRRVPEGHADHGGRAAMGTFRGGQSLTDRHKTVVNYWNIDLGENGEKCLCSALKDCDSQESLAPSTMFLLDLSKSMHQSGRITQMKEAVRNVLQEAASKNLGSQMSETYGVAVFGHRTEILQYPTNDLHEVQNVLDLDRFEEPAGRSPLGLGLILSTCVWFSEKGTGGTVWLHGRKVKPRIVVITDLELNETASGAWGMAGDQDIFASGSAKTIEVKNELIKIALKLKKLGIPVFLMSVGDTAHTRRHFEPVIEMTGGKLLDIKFGGQLGRQTWQQILACNILKQLANEWDQMSPEDFQNIIRTFTGDDPDDMDVIRRIMTERTEREKKEEEIKSLLNLTGEPGEQLWNNFPLGDRVKDLLNTDQTGTVVGHLPDKNALVQWDDKPTGQLESRFMTYLIRGTPRDCREYHGETHLVGSSVRKITHVNRTDEHQAPIKFDTDVGTVVTLSALQPNIIYVAWNSNKICRHSSFDICRFPEKDANYQYDWYWLFCDSGQWQPFPLAMSRTIEMRREANQRTILIENLGGKRYRLMFSKNEMRCIESCTNYPVFRQAINPP